MATATTAQIDVENVESVELTATDFTPAQQAVLEALAAGASKVDAAKAARVHRSSINNWQQTLPGYHEAVLSAQAEYRASLLSLLRRVSVKALDKLEALLEDPTTPPSVLLRSIQFTLTRPRFPDREWALPENVNPAPIQKVQESMDLIEAETKASMQYDKLKAKSVKNVENAERVESLRQHLPVTSHIPLGHQTGAGDDCAERVENVESVEPPSRHRQTASPGATAGTARNAPCPCGSGQKHKRCCGKFAAPQLQSQSAA